MLVKVLGGIDFVVGLLFVLIGFGLKPFSILVWIFALVMLFKGLIFLPGSMGSSFMFLSGLDILSGLTLFVYLIVDLPGIIVWTFALGLISKGATSFV